MTEENKGFGNTGLGWGGRACMWTVGIWPIWVAIIFWVILFTIFNIVVTE